MLYVSSDGQETYCWLSAASTAMICKNSLMGPLQISFFISFLPAFVPFLECIIPCIIDLARQIMKEDFLTCIKVCAQSQKCAWMELVAVKVEGDEKEI